MLSPEEREYISALTREISKLNRAASMYTRSLERLTDSLSDNRHAQEDTDRFTEDEVKRLMSLNRRLGEIESLVREAAHELRPSLIGKIENQNDLMSDFEIDVEIDFILRDDDLEASEDSDNILATRSELSVNTRDEADDEDVADFRESCNSETDQLAAEPHCYLFHDLYDHSYGVEQPRVPLRDCLRIGSVWIDVIIRQQYCLDLETGKWDKSWGDRKLAATLPGGST